MGSSSSTCRSSVSAGATLEQAILDAIDASQWVMGLQVKELEGKLAEFAGVEHAIACANGHRRADDRAASLECWAG